MLKIAVCEDEKIYADQINNLIQEYASLNSVMFDVQLFTNGHTLLSSTTKFDLIFLDIGLPDYSGMDIATMLRNNGLTCNIVFTTSHKELVFQAFKVKAFDYLVKPISSGVLTDVMQRVLDSQSNIEMPNLALSERRGHIRQFHSSEIIYIETHKRKALVHTLDSKYEVIDKISEIEKMTKTLHFFRPHTSYLINLEHVKSFGKGMITMSNGDQLLLSRLKEKDFKLTLKQFALQRV